MIENVPVLILADPELPYRPNQDAFGEFARIAGLRADVEILLSRQGKSTTLALEPDTPHARITCPLANIKPIQNARPCLQESVRQALDTEKDYLLRIIREANFQTYCSLMTAGVLVGTQMKTGTFSPGTLEVALGYILNEVGAIQSWANLLANPYIRGWKDLLDPSSHARAQIRGNKWLDAHGRELFR